MMFDLDGTLADTGGDLAAAVNFTRRQFRLTELPEEVACANVGRGVEHLLKQTVPETAPERFPEVMRVFLDYYEKHLLDRTVLYPGAAEMLGYFRAKRRALVSNKVYRLSLAMVEGLGIAGAFDAILGGDSVAEKKPHPAMLEAVLARFSISPGDAVLVGDSEIDIEAGKRAGVITCGVTYGLGDPKAMAASQPDVTINRLAELADFFC